MGQACEICEFRARCDGFGMVGELGYPFAACFPLTKEQGRQEMAEENAQLEKALEVLSVISKKLVCPQVEQLKAVMS